MSASDYLISLKPIPKPKVSPSLGIPDIPQSGVSQSGSFGESSIDSGIPALANIAQTGFIFGQKSTTVAIAQPKNGATTAEYETAIESVYASIPPKYGDIITLRDSSNGAFDSRWIVFPNDDSAPANATISFTSPESSITWYAYNLSATSVSAITDAINQALSQFDTTGTVPRDDDIDEEVMSDVDADFTISITNIYDTLSSGTLEIGSSVPNVFVKGGTITPMHTVSGTVPDSSNSSLTTPTDDDPVFLHIYVKYELTFTGNVGSRVVNDLQEEEIVYFKSTVDAYKEGGFFSNAGSKYTHFMYIGNVQLAKRDGRRFCKIVQFRSGAINGIQNFNTTDAGTSTDSQGNDVASKTAAGLREVILCLDGVPYTTFIITSALTEKT